VSDSQSEDRKKLEIAVPVATKNYRSAIDDRERTRPINAALRALTIINREQTTAPKI
jgi:hypothetical protein